MLWVLAQGRGDSVSDCPRAWLGLLTPLCPIGDRRDTASPGCSAPLAGIQHRSSGQPAARAAGPYRPLPHIPGHRGFALFASQLHGGLFLLHDLIWL